MRFLINLIFLLPIMFKWIFIFSLKLIQFSIYVIVALVMLIFKFLGVDLTKNSSYQFEGVEKELSKIDNLDGIEFEHYIANLLKKLGYSNVKVSKASGDYGIDIVANKDNEKHAFQCKRYNSKVNNSAIQEVVAGLSMYNCSKAIVVTNNFFTENATKLAISNNVELWDRDKLANLIRQIL